MRKNRGNGKVKETVFQGADKINQENDSRDKVMHTRFVIFKEEQVSGRVKMGRSKAKSS